VFVEASLVVIIEASFDVRRLIILSMAGVGITTTTVSMVMSSLQKPE